MSKIDDAALRKAIRKAAEDAQGKTTWQALQTFHAVVTPEVVLALLDRIERQPAVKNETVSLTGKELAQYRYEMAMRKGLPESRAICEAAKVFEGHLNRIMESKDKCFGICTVARGNFSGDDPWLIQRGYFPGHYNLPEHAVYWIDRTPRQIVLEDTGNGLLDVDTGAMFTITEII